MIYDDDFAFLSDNHPRKVKNNTNRVYEKYITTIMSNMLKIRRAPGAIFGKQDALTRDSLYAMYAKKCKEIGISKIITLQVFKRDYKKVSQISKESADIILNIIDEGGYHNKILDYLTKNNSSTTDDDGPLYVGNCSPGGMQP
jgi:hypothetical protein